MCGDAVKDPSAAETVSAQGTMSHRRHCKANICGVRATELRREAAMKELFRPGRVSDRILKNRPGRTGMPAFAGAARRLWRLLSARRGTFPLSPAGDSSYGQGGALFFHSPRTTQLGIEERVSKAKSAWTASRGRDIRFGLVSYRIGGLILWTLPTAAWRNS